MNKDIYLIVGNLRDKAAFINKYPQLRDNTIICTSQGVDALRGHSGKVRIRTWRHSGFQVVAPYELPDKWQDNIIIVEATTSNLDSELADRPNPVVD